MMCQHSIGFVWNEREIALANLIQPIHASHCAIWQRPLAPRHAFSDLIISADEERRATASGVICV
jgi:hypothetical protein